MCLVMDNPPLPAELNAARLLNHKWFSIFFAWDTVYPIMIYGDILLAHSSALFRDYTCQLSHRHYAWVSHLWTSGIGLMHQFLAPDSQIQTNCSLTHDS